MVKSLSQGLASESSVKASPSSAGGVSLIPGLGAKIPHASQLKNKQTKKKQKQKQKQFCNKSNKEFRNSPHQKKFKSKKLVLSKGSIPP